MKELRPELCTRRNDNVSKFAHDSDKLVKRYIRDTETKAAERLRDYDSDEVVGNFFLRTQVSVFDTCIDLTGIQLINNKRNVILLGKLSNRDYLIAEINAP